MNDFAIARVTVDSPLPQLDRLFDYALPEALRSQVATGIRVRVPFGRSKKLVEALIVELVVSSEFEGKLGEVAEVVSPLSVLTPEIYQLARQVADRQAATLADVLKTAIPTRSVKIEQKYLELRQDAIEDRIVGSQPQKPQAELTTNIAPPYMQNFEQGEYSAWALQIAKRAMSHIEKGFSVIACMPDFRDHAVLASALKALGLQDHVVDYSSDQVKSKRYAAFLKCLDSQPVIVIGSRAAIYAPVKALGEVFIYDDGDPNMFDQSSPYIHVREVALLRQRISGCSLSLIAHSRSTEVQRLVELNYLRDTTIDFVKPQVAVSEQSSRVDTLAWNSIRAALERGESVLVQVTGKGNAVSAYCKNCSQRAKCERCNGPLWLDSQRQPRCRWCNAINLQHRCASCSSTELRSGRAGSNRTAQEFGKAFPGVPITEATGERIIENLAAGRQIVVATAGAEPRVKGGYGAVILLDAQDLLNRDTLRATEEAVRLWSNAVALMKRGGKAVLVGAAGQLGQQFALWNISRIAAHELASRRELDFAPQVRVASLSGESKVLELLVEQLQNQTEISNVQVLGPIYVQDGLGEKSARYLLKYSYAIGFQLAAWLKSTSLTVSAGTKSFSSRSGRAQRPIRIKMDDSEVV